MRDACMHALTEFDMCPAKCSFETCDRPTYEFTNDPELVFDATIDRNQALKQGCLWCRFFLTNAPRRTSDRASEFGKKAVVIRDDAPAAADTIDDV
ncbi:MAG: hypothetical protein FWG78_01680 [Coriobacteriia bacterium]|nr:hypothetical protein [Coriobacteriia bacterium]